MPPADYPPFLALAAVTSARGGRGEPVGRLLEKAPDLLSLTFTLREAWPGGWLGSETYVRRVSLERAPARVEIRCAHGHCRGGAFDLTAEVLAGLRQRRARFGGECRCSGQHGAIACTRVLKFVATARYKPRLVPPGSLPGLRLGSDVRRGAGPAAGGAPDKGGA